MGFLRLSRPSIMPAIPITAPYKVAKKNESKTSFVPTIKPKRPNSLISPPPMPPLLITAINNNSPKPTAAPSNESHHGPSGRKNRINKKTTVKNRSILSGINIYVTSDTKIIIQSEINDQATNNSLVQPSTNGAAANNSPVINSTIG